MQTIRVQLAAVFRKTPKAYISFVEELPGGNTQGATLDEARANIEEAVVLEPKQALADEELRKDLDVSSPKASKH